MPLISDDDDVLMPDASHIRPIDAWFNRKDLAGAKGRRRKSRFLVNFKLKPVTSSMKEPAPASVSNGRRIATLGKRFLPLRNLTFGDLAECLKDALLPNKAGLPHVSSALHWLSRELPCA